MVPQCPWPNHPSTLPACPSLCCTLLFNPILDAALKCACRHWFYSRWVQSFAVRATVQQESRLKPERQLTSHFPATLKEEKLTLKPRKEANAAQAQPEKLHGLPAQRGRRSPRSLSPTRSARQLCFPPSSVIHSRKVCWEEKNSFVLALETWQPAYQQRISLETQSRSTVILSEKPYDSPGWGGHWTEMLPAAELGSLAAAVARSSESRMLSRLAGCLRRGWEQRRMQGWPGKKRQSSSGVPGGAWDVSAETLHSAVLSQGRFLFREK